MKFEIQLYNGPVILAGVLAYIILVNKVVYSLRHGHNGTTVLVLVYFLVR